MKFLTIRDLNNIHIYQIQTFGAQYESDLIGNGERLNEVVKSIQEFKTLCKTIAEHATQYIIWFRAYEPYWDGNDRTGAMAALVFLEMNGYTYKGNPYTFYGYVHDLYKELIKEDDFVEFFNRDVEKK